VQENKTSRRARTLISLIAALEMCEYELFCINFINEEKSGEYSRSDWVPERPPTQNLRVAA